MTKHVFKSLHPLRTLILKGPEPLQAPSPNHINSTIDDQILHPIQCPDFPTSTPNVSNALHSEDVFSQVRSARSALALGAALGARDWVGAALGAASAALGAAATSRVAHNVAQFSNSIDARSPSLSFPRILSFNPPHAHKITNQVTTETLSSALSNPSQHPTSRRKWGKRFLSACVLAEFAASHESARNARPRNGTPADT